MKLIFLHIPKTAGTSLKSSLDSTFSKDKIYNGQTMLDYEHQTREDLLKYDFLSGHIYYKFIDKHKLYNEYKIITVLRNPINRVVSLYKFWHSHSDDFFNNPDISEIIKKGPRMARELSFLDFIDSDDGFINQNISNNQCLQLCSENIFNGFKKRDHQEILTDVMNNLKKISVVGFAENLNYFRNQLKDKINIDIPEIGHKNVSKVTKSLWNSEEEKQIIVQKIINKNKLDVSLFLQILSNRKSIN